MFNVNFWKCPMIFKLFWTFGLNDFVTLAKLEEKLMYAKAKKWILPLKYFKINKQIRWPKE